MKNNPSSLEDRILEITNRLDIRNIVKIDHQGNCPYCNSKRWYLNKTNYICQGCDASGDAIVYLMSTRSMSLDEAVNNLYKKVMSEAPGSLDKVTA